MPKPQKVFLVEDETELIDIYKAVFSKEGFEVEEVRFGADAQEEIEKWIKGERPKPAFIILDLILPDMNGIVLLKKIKSEKETRDIPIFVLTNYSSKEIEKTLQNYKVEGYFVKTDISPQDLLKLIKKVLEKK